MKDIKKGSYNFIRSSRKELDLVEKILREVPSEIKKLKREKIRYQKKRTACAAKTAADIEELSKFLKGRLDDAKRRHPSLDRECKIAAGLLK